MNIEISRLCLYSFLNIVEIPIYYTLCGCYA